MFKENGYHEEVSVLSGQTRFILKEMFSGPIQKRSKFTRQYYRYTFVSDQCCSLMNKLICSNCNAIKRALQRLFWGRYEHNNKVLHAKMNTSKIVNEIPSKAVKSIEMVVGKLRSVQMSSIYLKSRLEGQ